MKVAVVSLILLSSTVACTAISGVEDLDQITCEFCAAPTQEPATPMSATVESERATEEKNTTAETDAGSDGNTTGTAPLPDASLPDASVPVPLSLTALALNGQQASSIQVALGETVAVSFQVSGAASCQLNGVGFAGTTRTIAGYTAVGGYPQTVACTGASGTVQARFTVVVVDRGRWLQANRQDCPTFCAGQGKSNTPSPSGFRCAAGEQQPSAAERATYGNFSYSYGTFGGERATSDAASAGVYCYSTGQKRDNDGSDQTVACFCKQL